MASRHGFTIGCVDNSCWFGSPGGMGTNGGCRCVPSALNATKEEVLEMRHLVRTLAHVLHAEGVRSESARHEAAVERERVMNLAAESLDHAKVAIHWIHDDNERGIRLDRHNAIRDEVERVRRGK